MYNKKQIIWVDIGSHFGQEYKSIFYSDFYFYRKIFRRFVASKFFSKGEFYGFNNLLKLVTSRKRIKQQRNFFHFTFIEANPKILQKKIYNEAHDVFCLAISYKEISIGKLFHANNDETSQGNSIYKNKGNVNTKNFTPCLILSAKRFAGVYKKYLDEKFIDYQLILRLNNEGSEDDTIYAFHETFKKNLVHVFGSLKDVRSIKGDESYNQLKNYLKTNDIPFTKFSSSINTWQKAFKELENYIHK